MPKTNPETNPSFNPTDPKPYYTLPLILIILISGENVAIFCQKLLTGRPLSCGEVSKSQRNRNESGKDLYRSPTLT